MPDSEILWLAASVERYSEHPLAEAVRSTARNQNLSLAEPQAFEAIPGHGVRANVNGSLVVLGIRRFVPGAESLPLAAELEAQGKTLLFLSREDVLAGVSDGVNDAPALAQANIGIAMGAAGTDIAIEAAHIALMREDWTLVPEVLRIARRTMGVVKMNLAFTAIYNVVGLTLAALGVLPPIFAAAAQSLPDLGILANSARLLRQADSKS